MQRQILNLRRCGRLKYANISDATRWMRKPCSYSSIKEALAETARLYRRNLWQYAKDYVEVWIEKDALAGVICPITEQYDVPLMVARGFSSETFAYEAVAARDDDPRDYYVYTLATSIAPVSTPHIRLRRSWSDSPRTNSASSFSRPQLRRR